MSSDCANAFRMLLPYIRFREESEARAFVALIERIDSAPVVTPPTAVAEDPSASVPPVVADGSSPAPLFKSFGGNRP